MTHLNPKIVSLLVLPALLGACQDYVIETREYQEVFEQPGELRSADILFVIDNSASMGEEQTLLAENFSGFVDILTSTYADYQIGVVTTDVEADDAGMLREGILSPDTVDISTVFQAAVQVGSRGSRDEQGLQAAMLAIDGRNAGFVRPDSRLNIVFVSDEDDHSEELVSTYSGAFAEFAGTSGFVAHGLVGDLPYGCVSGTSAADAGARYLEVITATGGWRDSICADDYSQLLTNVGLDLSGWQSSFAMTDVPNPGSLVVTVDAVLIPMREVDGWMYSIGDNAINFYGHAIPRPGMQIVVEYTPWVGASDAGLGDDTGGGT